MRCLGGAEQSALSEQEAVRMYKKSKWKRVIVAICAIIIIIAMVATMVLSAFAKESASGANDTIAEGIYIGSVYVGGMTAEEAQEAIRSYVEEISQETITLVAEDNLLEATLADLGISEDVEATIEEALAYGKTGNLVKRYKAQKDLENEDKVLPLTFVADEEVMTAYLEEHVESLNQEAIDYSLTRENGQFVIIEGQNGLEVNVEESVEAIAAYFADGWQGETSIDLIVEVTEPLGTEEQLSKVQDVLGTYTTNYSSSASGRKTNVARGAALINGTVLYPGETFSVYEAVNPFSAENGYALAGSYENGTTVETYGGGICQVSSTLYNAVIRAELDIVERYGHSMLVSYVDPSADAAIAGTYKDLKFTNNTDSPIYIEGATDGTNIRFTIYGEETRASNRSISFVSETTSTTEATVEFTTTSDAIGTITKVQSSHTGKTARLWKIVTVDGVEESREVFNNTTYKMSPTIYEVGISSSNSEAVAAMKAAIATNDLATIQAAAKEWSDSALAAKAAAEEAAAAATEETTTSSSSSESSSTSSTSTESTSTESTTTAQTEETESSDEE